MKSFLFLLEKVSPDKLKEIMMEFQVLVQKKCFLRERNLYSFYHENKPEQSWNPPQIRVQTTFSAIHPPLNWVNYCNFLIDIITISTRGLQNHRSFSVIRRKVIKPDKSKSVVLRWAKTFLIISLRQHRSFFRRWNNGWLWTIPKMFPSPKRVCCCL